MRNKIGWGATLPVAGLLTLIFATAGAQERRAKEPEPVALASERATSVIPRVPQAAESLALTVGKSMLLDSTLPMNRVSVGLGGFAEVTAASEVSTASLCMIVSLFDDALAIPIPFTLE